jgi:hypothetical protein
LTTRPDIVSKCYKKDIGGVQLTSATEIPFL